MPLIFWSSATPASLRGVGMLLLFPIDQRLPLQVSFVKITGLFVCLSLIREQEKREGYEEVSGEQSLFAATLEDSRQKDPQNVPMIMRTEVEHLP